MDVPRILFVDDETAIHDGIRRALARYGHPWELVFEADPESALRRTEAESFDVAVLDLRMPKLDGATLAADLKRRRPDTVVLMLTGHADLDTAVRLINEVGVFRFYLKPTGHRDLEAGLREAVARHAELRRARTRDDRPSDSLRAQVLDLLPIGVVAVGGGLQVRHSNAKAQEILNARDGLLVDGGGLLRGGFTDDSAAIQAAVTRVATGTELQFCAIRRPSGLEPYSATITGLAAAGDPDLAAYIFIGSPRSSEFPNAEAIARTFGLVPSEARLVAELVCGGSLEEASVAVGITRNSARTYLKSIFGKTGVGRQADLVRLVLTSAAAFVRSPAAP